jgi:hypothetical protein
MRKLLPILAVALCLAFAGTAKAQCPSGRFVLNARGGVRFVAADVPTVAAVDPCARGYSDNHVAFERGVRARFFVPAVVGHRYNPFVRVGRAVVVF